MEKEAEITSQQAKKIIELMLKPEVSTLELLEGRAEITPQNARINGIEADKKSLEKIAKEGNSIYLVTDNNGKAEFKKISFFNGKVYRLVFENGVTLEINGVRMHQTKESTPMKDAENKARLLKLKHGEKVLDICTGLGYSSITAAEKGVLVTTIENDENVIEIAKFNPASEKLFDFERKGKIHILIGDAFDEIDKLKDESFEAISCDAPFYNFAPGLYSNAFFEKLAKKLKKGGRLFFYIGNKESKSVGKIFRGVNANLANYFKCKYYEKERGFLCFKKG